MQERFPQFPSHPVCRACAAVSGAHWRFTVLTPRLLRLEYSESGRFEDRATQMALNRDFDVPPFNVSEEDGVTVLETEALRLCYGGGRFSSNNLTVRLKNGRGLHANTRAWHYGETPRTLGGTARTLDGADGAVPLDPGLISREGYAVVDDSDSMALTEDGWVAPREPGGADLYFFGYGHDYAGCVRDFYRLSGFPPLLPRWALGNWWSRYHRYTQEEYEALVGRFAAEKLPFSVAVLDMDWHLVDIDPRYGTGWTGYTWNRDLFPDPPAFLRRLHEKGLRVTLNVHPADGARVYEDAYPAMAKAMGRDVKTGAPIAFDPADPRFLRAYFDCLHRPLEKQGVDFWWIDWQQGSASRVPGLDPLWMLNHYHFLDCAEHNPRPLVFSRYAGLGSHRYPVGFSGDTVVSWASLRFQPVFTAAASNVGYGWWSHDIGGHMQGVKDDELAVRWVQFGVFSPVMRLHSTSNPFNSKEPWRFGVAARAAMGNFLRLRRRLVPYLYSMNAAAADGIPLVRPMYWLEPERQEAYAVPGEYAFGSELLAAPVTDPAESDTLLGQARAWLPEGLWFDWFTGHVYRGGRLRRLWRPLAQMPVLAKAGGIVPLDGDTGADAAANPAVLEVRVWPGADGAFDLREDDGAQRGVKTALGFHWGDTPDFEISPAEGETDVLPAARRWRLCFCAVRNVPAAVWVNGRRADLTADYDEASRTLAVTLDGISPADRVQVVFEAGLPVAANDTAGEVFRLLEHAQTRYDDKAEIQRLVETQGADALAAIEAMELSRPLFSALCELLLP